MILAHHLIWTAYGWWLPNDPRGSTSRVIVSDVIAELGELHQSRKRVQPAGWEIQAFYDRAADILRHPLLTFTPREQRAIGEAFAATIAREKHTCGWCG